jgi:hypothetical protein
VCPTIILLDTESGIDYIAGVRSTGQNFTPEIIERIQAMIDANPAWSRRKLSVEVCDWLDWRSPNGKVKEMSCRVALLKLHRDGVLNLPAAGAAPPRRGTPSRDGSEAEKIAPLHCPLSKLGEIEIVRIKNSDSQASRRWNRLMNQYHYLGSGPLCGAQLRYLIRSERHGDVGGFAFSAAAWRLAAREHWIGWDEEARRQNLNKVINNSRFLIVPQVEVKNLASHALSLVMKRLVGDWLERYGIAPVLVETFVERERFRGTSYRAANWMWLGTTKGRGRQDAANDYAVAVKDIYVYPLREDAVAILCEGSPPAAVALSVKDKPLQDKVYEDWADDEFGAAQLGDQRRVKRLLSLARDFYARPQANIPQACQSRAKTKAAYRFFDDEDHTMEKLLAAHYESTRHRTAHEKVVLAVQDTSFLNYSAHPATENLGPIATTADGTIGLVLHDTLALNLERTPLGLLNVQCWARDPAQHGKRHQCHDLPIEQKESNKWLASYRAVAAAQKRCPATMFVSVGDREADIYELFQLALGEPHGPKLLVRAERDRLLADGQGHLWDYVKAQPLAGLQEVQIPRRGKRPARVAQLEIRFAEVKLKAPKRKPELGEVIVWAIVAEEVNYAVDIEDPLQWLLLTTLVVETFEQAVEKLDWYSGRWSIEVYHRTLKSGCKIEERQLGSADRIEACLAIDLVVAWRIFHLTKLGREVPEVPCTVFFEEAEWKALVAYKTGTAVAPEQPPSLREATRMVASLGGFLGRKGDGEAGTKTLWLGLQRLDDLTAMWKITMSASAPQPPSPAVSSRRRYG